MGSANYAFNIDCQSYVLSVFGCQYACIGFGTWFAIYLGNFHYCFHCTEAPVVMESYVKLLHCVLKMSLHYSLCSSRSQVSMDNEHNIGKKNT